MTIPGIPLICGGNNHKKSSNKTNHKTFRKAKKPNAKRQRNGSNGLETAREAFVSPLNAPIDDPPTATEPRPIRGVTSHRKRGRKKAVRRLPEEINRDQERTEAGIASRAKKPVKPRKRIEPGALESAKSSYLDDSNATLRSISSKYGISKSTLHRRVNNQNSGHIGPPFKLGENIERDLAHALCNWCEKGSAILVVELRKIAVAYAKIQVGQHTTFKASDTWIRAFIKRWELCEWQDGKTKVLGMHRRISCSEKIVSRFITELFEAFNLYLRALSEALQINVPDLTDQHIAAGIFGLDETSLSNKTPAKFEPTKITPKSGKGSLQVMQSICSGQSSVCATLLELFCADGSAPFSFLTTKQALTEAEQLVLKEIVSSRTQLDFCFLETGKFNSDTHSQFLSLIQAHRRGLPSLVIQDCPAFHKTDEVLSTAQDEISFCSESLQTHHGGYNKPTICRFYSIRMNIIAECENFI